MARGVGCLVIDDLTGAIGPAAALARMARERGMNALAYDRAEAPLHLSLQQAYQRIRRDDAPSAIAAFGAGCDCALALAGQLPVDRLALVLPETAGGGGRPSGELRRVQRYARRGAAFCVADVLMLARRGDDFRMAEDLCNCRITLAECSEEVWTKRKDVINSAVLNFLRDGVLPKTLAENAEMCIIYA